MKGKVACLLLLAVPLVVPAQYKLYEKGHEAYVAAQYAEAITYLTEFLSKPTRNKTLDLEAYYLRALCYYKVNAFDKCIPDFEEAILLNHTNKPNIYWFKAKAHRVLNQPDNAIEDFSMALSLLQSQPQQAARVLLERSQLYRAKGMIVLAEEDLKKGKQLDPLNNDLTKELEELEKTKVALRGTTSENKAGQTQPQPQKGTQKPASTGTVQTTTKSAGENEGPNEIKKGVDEKKVSTPPKEEGAKVLVGNEATKTEKVPETKAPQSALAELYKDERRFALVIGNSAYPKEVGALKNPMNDATDVAKELENCNFNVQLLTNATYGQMRAALLKFKEKVDAGDAEKTVALFYFAGHGIQFEDENYLVPIDAAVEFEDDIARYCFPVQRMVLSNMERSNSRMNIVILDACRNNPFPALTRSSSQGLAELKRARGSFIAYATAPGSVASDGTGRNGLYTQELLKAMRQPGLTLEQVFKQVRANVWRLSGQKQNTWDSSNIMGDFYFKF